MKKFLLPAWLLVSISLILYSFTQVSLSLTLTSASIAADIQRVFQSIGYFNRPLSTGLFFLIIVNLYFLYIVTLREIWKKKINIKIVSTIVGIVAVVLLFSYNAFSHDLFNYIFDAKVVTQYHENPYIKRPLDFPSDPMLSFMHWTHRTYPYGPVWLGLTVPFSFAGLGYFLPTFYLFKLLSGAAYLGSCFLIYRSMQVLKKDYALFSTAVFALNPLVLVESLVSAHNDIVMIFFAFLSLYFLVQKKSVASLLLFVFAAGIKYATAFLAPMYAWIFYRRKDWERAVYIGIFCMVIAVIAASQSSGNFQPWYLLYIVTPATLLAYKKQVLIPMVVLSVGGSVFYIPYLYLGNWDPPVSSILQTGIAVTVAAASLSCIFLTIRKRI